MKRQIIAKIIMGFLLIPPTPISASTEEEFPSAQSISKSLKSMSVRESYLLAFKVIEDDRPLYVEQALIAEQLDDGKWRLSSVYRHPRENGGSPISWHLSVVFDADQSPTQVFDHRPSEAQVDAFLKHAWWTFQADHDFRLLKGQVFEATWEKALGYKPKHTFVKP